MNTPKLKKGWIITLCVIATLIGNPVFSQHGKQRQLSARQSLEAADTNRSKSDDGFSFDPNIVISEKQTVSQPVNNSTSPSQLPVKAYDTLLYVVYGISILALISLCVLCILKMPKIRITKNKNNINKGEGINYTPHRIVGMALLTFWILNPGLTQFKEHTGDRDVTKKYNFLVCSVYNDGSETYLGFLMNFVEIG